MELPVEPLLQTDLGPFVANAYGDRYLHAVNRSAFNQQGYAAAFVEAFGKEPIVPGTLSIIIGTDSGLLLQQLLQRGVPAGARVVFVELPQVLARLPEVVDLDALGERVAVVTQDQLFATLERFRFDDYVYLNNVFSRRSLGAVDAYLADYLPLTEAVLHEVRTQIWSRGVVLGTRPFLVRKLENLGENRHSANRLKGAFAGRTAVLLGGGPSLDALLPWVKANRDRLVVLAVSRVARRLLETGVDPHLIFIIDPHPISFDVSRETLAFAGRALLVHTDHATPHLVGQWQGRSLFLGTRFFWETSHNADAVEFAGPTVGNTALCFAAEMGFAQILLAGVDLCFSRDGFTHAQGSQEHAAGPKIGNLLKVETNDGGNAEAIEDFVVARELMGGQCAWIKSRGCRVINLSPSAARIANVEFLPPEAIELPAAEPVEARLEALLPQESAAERCRYFGEMLDELARVKQKLKPIRKLCQEALEVNAKLFAKGREPNFTFRKRLDRIEAGLNGAHREFSRIVRSFGIVNFIQITSQPRDGEMAAKELEAFGRGYYSAYKESVGDLWELVDAAETRLRARLEEESAQPDYDRLLRQWRGDRQPGRAQRWAAAQPQALAAAPPEIRAQLAELEREAGRMLRGEIQLAGRPAPTKPDLSAARAKANALFRQRDRAGLERLSGSLARIADPAAGPLADLTCAYRAVLDDTPELALAAYERIVELGPGPLLEDALIGLASLCIQQQDNANALLVLECLAGVAPIYLPQYAESLRAVGRVEEALEQYAAYLDRCPEDVPTLLRLGAFYRELQAEAGAIEIYQHVLELDPDNLAARQFLARLGAA